MSRFGSGKVLALLLTGAAALLVQAAPSGAAPDGAGPERAAERGETPAASGAAAEVAKAKAAFERGETLYRQGEFRKALAEYKRALEHRRFPAFIFNIAQCHRQLGEHERALFFYRLFLSEMPDAPNRVEIERWIRELAEKVAEAQRLAKEVGRLSVITRPRGAEVLLDRVDGPPLGRTPAMLGRVPVGQRLLVIRLAGYEEVTRKVEIQLGQLLVVEVDLKPLVDPSRQDPRQDPRRVEPDPGAGKDRDPRPGVGDGKVAGGGPGAGVGSGDGAGVGPGKGPRGGPAGASPFYKRWWFWGGVAATVGLLAASGVTGGMAKAKADRWNDPSQVITDPDDFKRSVRRLVATTDALWITGALMGVGTLVGALVVGRGRVERAEPRAVVSPACGPGGCGLWVQGRF